MRTVNFSICLFILFQVFSMDLLGQTEGLVQKKQAPQVITVGGQNSDMSGYTSAAIQIALDALKSRGGGTVKLEKGTFEITGPLRIPGNTVLSGSGQETILRKSDGFRTSFIIDADWGMLKAVVKDVSGFRTGMGIELYDDSHKNGWEVTTAVITDIKDNIIYFDNPTVNDYVASLNGTVSNACSVIEAVGVENVRISDLVIDGNGKANDYINGCRGGGVYIHKSKNCTVENVKISNFNGDTFSWQITENINIKGCEAADGFGLGFHPGTGSDHSIVENCISHGNKGDGIFLCWRVQNGIFRNNAVYSNGDNGISIGHKDTDNIFENNHVYENSNHGILFRTENEQNSGHRNTFSNNIIENNGTARESSGIYIGGETHDIRIEKNTIRSDGKGNQHIAVFAGKNTSAIKLTENVISGSRDFVQEK